MVCLKKRRPTSVSEVPTHFKVAPRDAARGWERPKPSLGQANGDAGVVQRDGLLGDFERSSLNEKPVMHRIDGQMCWDVMWKAVKAKTHRNLWRGLNRALKGATDPWDRSRACSTHMAEKSGSASFGSRTSHNLSSQGCTMEGSCSAASLSCSIDQV